MAEISRPWTGTATGDAGPYSADQWAAMYRAAFGNGAADADSGPIMGSGTAPDPGLTVNAQSPAALAVNVTLGAALVHGTFYLNDATKALSVDANGSADPRIDTVVLRKTWSTQTVRLAVLKGTPAVTPVAPTLTQTDLTTWEIPLADIAVASAAASIAQTNITPRRLWANVSDGIYLNDIKNNTAGILVAGDVVIRDTTADRAATTTTTVNDVRVLGIWVARSAASGYGRVLRQGIGYVNCATAVTRGDYLAVSATAKKLDVIPAAPTTGYNYNRVAVALETTTGAGLALCLVHIPFTGTQLKASQKIIWDNGADYATTSNTFVDIDGTNLVITMTITGSCVLVLFTCSAQSAGGVTPGFDILVDGVRYGAAGTAGLFGWSGAAGPVGIAILITGLSPGSHTFKPQYHTTAATTVTVRAGAGGATDFVPSFAAVELF